MSAIIVSRLYELLVPKLGKEATESLINFTDNKISSELESNTKTLANKEDLARFEIASREELAKTEARLDIKLTATRENLARLEIATREELAKTEARLDTKITATREDLLNFKASLEAKIIESKAETIKWMFIFWVGQVLATTGSILLFFKR